MNRRLLLQSIVAIPAAAAVADTPPPAVQLQINPETPTTPVVPPVETSKSLRRTFSPDQFYALTRLGEIIVPPYNGLPGAADCGAADFL